VIKKKACNVKIQESIGVILLWEDGRELLGKKGKGKSRRAGSRGTREIGFCG